MGATNKINGKYKSDKELYRSNCLIIFFPEKISNRYIKMKIKSFSKIPRILALTLNCEAL